MQLARIMPSSVLDLITLCYVGRRYREFGIDLVEGVLGGGQAELVLEERSFGGVSIGGRQIQALGRIDELLGLLDDVCEVGEHGSGSVSGA